MDGDFKTDITRDTFNINKVLHPHEPERRFSRVLKQQGRVDLDADWNELVDILLQQQRTALTDIIGPHAGPADAWGFSISKPSDAKKTYTLHIGKGRYYVDGILCYTDEFEYSIPKDQHVTADGNGGAHYLVYLDVWEREVTSLEDDVIRESALGGVDTATRAEVVFQIRFGDAIELAKKFSSPEGTPAEQKWTDLLQNLSLLTHYGLLSARPDPNITSTEPCVTPPSSTYRGLENQLYRVEIHHGGTAYTGDISIIRNRSSSHRDKPQKNDKEQDYATFKWSRENGSIAFLVDGPISINETINVTLKNLGADDTRYSLQTENWVELIDLSLVPNEIPGPLFQVKTVDSATMQVTLTIGAGQKPPAESELNGPFLLRRWDYKEGDPQDTANNDQPITIGADGAAVLVEKAWLTLENGVQIEFFSDDKGTTQYRTGDYWLIPARVATGEIEWPFTINARNKRESDTLPPHGIAHHYAPLALVTFDKDGNIIMGGDGKPTITELRRKIKQGWDPA
jgi:hypothetical protein